jgi:transposase-like protein
MHLGSTLTREDAAAAVEMFEEGYSAKSVARSTGLARNSIQMLHSRWQVRGRSALDTRERRLYSFETILEIVRRLNRPGFVGDFILWKRGWSHGQKQQDRSEVFG